MLQKPSKIKKIVTCRPKIIKLVMTQPLISVVMPAYNAAAYIDQAVQSLINQTYTHWELLIADDGSSDTTRQKIAAYKGDARIRILPNDKNMGYLSTCNRLFSLSQGDYLTFLDADDYCPPERLALQLAAFEANPNLGMVGTAYDICDMSGKLIDTVVKPLDYAEIRAKLPTQSTFCGATIMISREVYTKIGGYRVFFNDYAYQDYDWAYCIADEFESINLPQSLYTYRQAPNSNSKKISARRYVSAQIVQYLGKQRAERGQDDIQLAQLDPLNAFIESLLAPFSADPSLIYRKYAESFMYNRLYRTAIATSWQAIRHAPTKFINYRTWLYCLRVSLWRTIFKS
jgi:glycosyltransferase involved in cell wall biosynthesis